MNVRRCRGAAIGAAVAVACTIAVGSAQQQPGQQAPPRDTSALPSSSSTSPTSPAPTGRLSGRVIASDTGHPIKRARVFISAGELPGGRGMLTDDDGAFDFTELPAGRYAITASKSGYLQLSYGQRRPLQAGTPLQLLDTQQLKGIDFALPKGGVLTGRVSDESGDVMPGVVVSVSRYQYAQGDRQLVPAGNAQTDDRGVYRVWGLNPGDYYVSAVATGERLGLRGAPGFLNPGVLAAQGGRGGRGGRGAATSDEQDQLMYAPTYFPGVPSVAEARAITVGVSQEVLDIDFGLQLVRTARVSGHVENPDGSWATNGNVTMSLQSSPRSRALGSVFGGRIGWDGQFSVANVPPGSYTLRARNNDRDAPLSTSQPLNVGGGGDLSGVLVVLEAGGSIAGRIVFEPGTTSAPSDVTQVRIAAPAADPDDNTGPAPSPRVNRDGTFSIDGVSPGSHLVRPNGGGALRGWNLKSVIVDGRDVTDTPIDVRSNQKIGNVVVTFTDKVNEIDGAITDTQSNPVTEYTVLAFSTNSDFWRPQSRQIATARPDQTGMYKIRNLPAGEYYIVAVDPSEPGEWFEPAYLDQHRAGAARLTLGDGDTKTQDFRVSR